MNLGHHRQTNSRLAHAEAAANTLIGIIIGQGVLFAFGVPVMEAVPITVIIISLSYMRSFVLRLIFRRFERRKDIGGHVPHGSL
jgi:hypothetical protein